ncbi:MAG: hypothetical protein JOS17DRAFT_796152 [Linnemannia elongata]|nr:MAG: hypothetical protein JOS17DRAFT_796152 [Linnemannia elongata]
MPVMVALQRSLPFAARGSRDHSSGFPLTKYWRFAQESSLWFGLRPHILFPRARAALHSQHTGALRKMPVMVALQRSLPFAARGFRDHSSGFALTKYWRFAQNTGASRGRAARKTLGSGYALT